MISPVARTILLWVHACAGAIWIAAAASFVIAALATAEEADTSTIRRAGSAINRIGLFAMVAVVLTGIINTFVAGEMRNFAFSQSFVVVLALKIVALAAMIVILNRCVRAHRIIAAEADAEISGRNAIAKARTQLIVGNSLVAAIGGLAMILGLWLLGT